jgi:hypothetical protein
MGTDSTEMFPLVFVANAVIVYVILEANSVSNTVVSSIPDVAKPVVWPLALAYTVYVDPPAEALYDMVVEVPLILDEFNPVGAAGADNMEISADSIELLPLVFVAIAVIVYVILGTKSVSDTEVSSILDVAKTVVWPLALAYTVYVEPPAEALYDIVAEVPLIFETDKSVGSAGADNAVAEPDSTEIPPLAFVANAVIVYVVLFESPARVAIPV